ncbi:hypothetical protein lerEdw1_004383, partial [Lerista edwardsae]
LRCPCHPERTGTVQAVTKEEVMVTEMEKTDLEFQLQVAGEKKKLELQQRLDDFFAKYEIQLVPKKSKEEDLFRVPKPLKGQHHPRSTSASSLLLSEAKTEKAIKSLLPAEVAVQTMEKCFTVEVNVEDLRQLKQRISDVLDSITPDMLAKVWQELDYRIDICRVTGGAHIEQL